MYQSDFIAPFDTLDGDPARYVEFLRDTYRNAKRILREPVQQWPRGSSHDISRAIMLDAEIIAQDMAIDYGLFDPFTGRVVDYARR